MKRGLIVVSALAAVCTIVGLSSAFAFGPGCCKSKDAKTTKMAKSDSCSRTCGSMDEFPSISMKVGDKSYDCCMSAEAAAKKAGTKVLYVVADEKFECKEKAMAALACASEKFVDRYLTIACVADGKVMYCEDEDGCSSSKTASASCQKDAKLAKAETKDEAKTCPLSGQKIAKSDDKAMAKTGSSTCCKSKSGKSMTKAEIEACCKNAKELKFMVCGRTFKSRDEAAKARDAALKSVANIRMTYLVDGKEVDCSSKVCPKAKADGKVKYVVNKEQMDCEDAARVAAARAKYEAARNYAEKLAKI